MTSELASSEPERAQRAKLAETIRRYLGSQMSAFEFDEVLEEFRDSTDPVARFVAEQAWFFYDDCKDHLVVMNREGWNYFQRLLLLLASNCRLETRTEASWSRTQIAAATGVAVFIAIATQIGLNRGLLLYCLPFGAVSVLLSKVRRESQPDKNSPSVLYPVSVLYPFATFRDLRVAVESSNFVKVPYPREISDRQIRSAATESYLLFQFYVWWMFMGPLVLLFEMKPRKVTTTLARTA